MLTLTHVTKRFPGGVTAVNDVSLDLKAGVVGLLGPNGAGKTTLMQMVATITKPTEGQVTFQGVDIIKDPETPRRQLGYLPQDFGVYDNLTAFEFLSYFAGLKGVTSRSRAHFGCWAPSCSPPVITPGPGLTSSKPRPQHSGPAPPTRLH